MMNSKGCSGICAFCRFNCRAEEGEAVVSSISGRIRLRDDRLKRKETALALESRLGSCAAVRSAAWNRRTGSMLIIYDAASVSHSAILGLLNPYLPVMRKTGKVCSFKARGVAGNPPAVAAPALRLVQAVAEAA